MSAEDRWFLAEFRFAARVVESRILDLGPVLASVSAQLSIWSPAYSEGFKLALSTAWGR